ncbi:MAG: hypothetical protein ABIQ62_04250 [Thermomonas sp.]
MTRLTTLLAFALATPMLAACAVPYNVGVRAVDGATVALLPGETARLTNGGSLRYLQLVNDSRCPPDVQCVWAGDAVIALQWMPATGATRGLELHLNPRADADSNHIDLDGRRITFTALSRQGAQASLQVTTQP